VARRQSVSEIQCGRPDTLSKTSTWPLLAAINRSRFSRGSARSGAVIGSTSARRIVENVDLADPCSPESTSTGYGPQWRSAAVNHAIASTKCTSERTFRKQRQGRSPTSTRLLPSRDRRSLATQRGLSSRARAMERWGLQSWP